MIIANTVREVRNKVKAWKAAGLTIGLVPTMGALHEGHASLVDAASRECDRVVTSVFVNPTQFGKGEDLNSYPRSFDNDCRVLDEHGCDLVFHPSVKEMYPDGYGTYVNLETEMTEQLCGKSRPGHFRGVCTVVSKLFNIASPDRAYFGQKDAQQLAVIRRMVSDMNVDVEVVGCPTVREADGLAKSSRNSYLNDEERSAALVLHRAIEAAQQMIATRAIEYAKADSEAATPEFAVASADIVNLMTDIVSAEPLAKIDYIDAVDGLSLMPKERVSPGDLVAMAVYIGKTRLIDNFVVE